ncbi:MAG: LuxR C-terminal-related transcriptional regulator [Solirubrobacterales bacterium]
MSTKDSVATVHGAAASHSATAGSALVPRVRLIAKLNESAAPVVLLNAPSGYGKSVLLQQWAAGDPRPFAPIILGDAHNDPALLVGSILEALEQLDTMPAHVSAALHVPSPSIEGIVLPRLGRTLADWKVPMVLVLDDLEHVESPRALGVIAALARDIPSGSRLALASRTEPALPIGALRAHRMLTEIGRADLKMTKAECEALLVGLGMELTAEQLDLLARHTEGWPAAMYLAGLALSGATDMDRAISRFAGDDRIVVDYIREEFLEPVSRSRLEFMRRAAVLDRLEGELCDAVLECTGSAKRLVELSHSNMLLTPLDRRDEWFRFHAMFREMLLSELRRVEPAEEEELNLRASLWWAEQGDWDRAIQHAIEAHSTARAGELLWAGVPEYLSRGRNATVIAWLKRLGETTVTSDPALSLTAAFSQITRGAGSQAEHWAAVARSLVEKEEDSERKLGLTAGLALVEAALSRRGLAAMCASTEVAARVLPDESPWLSMCCMLDGVGLHLRGEQRAAHERLEEGARRGSVSAPTIQVLSLAQLSLLAIEEEDWQLAEMLASQAKAQVDRSGLIEYPMMSLVLAVSALVQSRFGKVDKAAAALQLSMGLLEKLDEFAPWYEVETRIVLARCASRLGERSTGSSLLVEAKRLVKRVPDPGVLGAWIEDVTAAVEGLAALDMSGLSPAELRLLQFLPGHLSYPQIASQTFVSPNTVKTQAQGIYRKLGASSRREAVELARSAGLLDRGAGAQDPSAPD